MSVRFAPFPTFLMPIFEISLWPTICMCDIVNIANAACSINLNPSTRSFPLSWWIASYQLLKRSHSEQWLDTIVRSVTHLPQRALNLKSCVQPIFLQEPLKHFFINRPLRLKTKYFDDIRPRFWAIFGLFSCITRALESFEAQDFWSAGSWWKAFDQHSLCDSTNFSQWLSTTNHVPACLRIS